MNFAKLTAFFLTFLLLIGTVFAASFSSNDFSMRLGNSSGSSYSAECVSNNLPSILRPSQSFNAQIVLKNSGKSAWVNNSTALFALAAVDPPLNTVWGISNIPVSSTVNAGQSNTFNFTITAPSSTGTYSANFQMGGKSLTGKQKGVFGNKCLKSIEVKNNVAPTLSISATPIEGYAPLTVQFNATASDSDGGSIVSYFWDFGDGTTSIEQNPIHIFESSKTFTITATVTDNEGAKTNQTTTIKTTQKPNFPPTITGLPDQSTSEDTALPSNFLDLWQYAADVEDSDSALTFSIASQSNSSLINCSIASNRYVNCNAPSANQSGNSAVIVQVKDAGGLTASDTFTITVNSVNDAPSFISVPNSPVSIDVGQAYSFTLQATDIDSSTLTYSDNTSLFDVNPSTGVISFTPSSSQVGSYDVVLTVSDGALTDLKIATFKVNAKPNNAPTLTGLPDQSTNEDTALPANFIDLWQYAADTEDVDSSLSFSIASQSNSSLINCSIAANRYLNCSVPSANAFGSSDVTIQVKDTANATASDTFRITVNSVNDVPTISGVPNVSFNEDSSTTLDVSPYISDIEDSKSSLTISVSGNSKISATVSGQKITFSSNTNNWSGSETITIAVKDSSNAIASQNITATVNAVNDAPSFTSVPNSPVSIEAGTAYSFTLKASDVDSSTLTFSDNTALFDVNPSTGVISFTPSTAQVGSYDVTLSVSDGSLTDSKIVTFKITAPLVKDLNVFELISPKQLFINNAFNFTVKVGNKGTNTETSTVRLKANGNDVATQNVTLNSNETKNITLSWTPTAIGNYTITTTIDALNGETSTADNSTIGGMITAYNAQNDLFMGINGPADVAQDTALTVGCTIKNLTSSTIYNMPCTISFPNGGYTLNDSATKTIDSIAPNTIQSVTFNVSSNSQSGTYQIKVTSYDKYTTYDVVISDTEPRSMIVSNGSQQSTVEPQPTLPITGNVVLSRPPIFSKPKPSTTVVSNNQSTNSSTTVYSPTMARILARRNKK